LAAYKEKCSVCNTWKKNTNKRELDKGVGACACNSIDYVKHKKKKVDEHRCLELQDGEEIRMTITGNTGIKKNSQRITYQGIRPSEGYEIWAGQALFQIKEFMKQNQRDPISGPVHIEAHYYRKSRVKCDLSNLHEGIQDCLTSMGFWLDDSIVESHDGSRKHYDKDNPRLEIIIRRFNE
jgi:Holliday junction resolvase RusA-like endonuclease